LSLKTIVFTYEYPKAYLTFVVELLKMLNPALYCKVSPIANCLTFSDWKLNFLK